MSPLTFFGLFAVSAMLVFYALEHRGHWFILCFAGACVLASIYGFLQGAWPFGLVEGVWTLVALRKWHRATRFLAVHHPSDPKAVTEPRRTGTGAAAAAGRSGNG